mmetsp:Transcript_19511/g.60254  ORF Transcript_19511/g.60254 Transcript_19511/m.60254 type:complete len:484 (+) Transcript_19511:85-1536(+)
MGKQKTGKAKSLAKKAPAMSKMGSKKRLSRMGKKRRKGETGNASSYVSRAVVLRRLQLTLKDFRRLCILKGIFPRDVPFRAGKDSKTYYHVKDAAALSREPLLEKFREFKTFMKRVRHLVGRGDVKNARRKHEAAPTYVLHHLVKERYPLFRDALNDVDDALSTAFLFASLPAEGRVGTGDIAKCDELCRRWNTYVARTGTLRKAFVSVKGVYFQATIRGVDVTWIVPHAFSHDLPSKRHVDYRVMLTFLEFYQTLLKFVLFKLFRDDAALFVDAAAAEDDTKQEGLFGELGFVLAREARYPWLDFLLKAGGGTVLADDDGAKATHLVTDRAPSSSPLEQIQPQWVVDSFNNHRLLPVKRYAPGAVLPPHLSPFVSNKEDDYKPAYQDELDGGLLQQKSAFAQFRDAAAAEAAQAQEQQPDEEEKEDRAELAKMMMSKKAKRLHGRMLHGIQRRKDAVDRLKARRARIEAQQQQQQKSSSSSS